MRLALCLCLVLATVSAWTDESCPDPFHNPGPVADLPMAKLTLLTDAAESDNAVCLDGSPGGYYFLPGTGDGANKWYIHHQGGGWCESLDDCYDRSSTTLGSSKTYPPEASLGGGYFSPNCTESFMCNWNKAFFRYCDGGSFSGSNSSTTTVNGKELHFRGHHILHAIMKDLMTNHGLASATDLVVSGCSAGGLATYLHADEWASIMPAATKVRALPDSGFFIDYEAPAPTEAHMLGTTIPGNYHDGLKWVFDTMNATSGINQDCIRAHVATDDIWKCMFAEHTSPFIKTPTFPLQSQYDHWQAGHILANMSNIPELGKNITARLISNLLVNKYNGAFLDSCLHHCGSWGDITIDGDNQNAAFESWYNDPAKKSFWNQAQPYPCEACCSNGQ